MLGQVLGGLGLLAAAALLLWDASRGKTDILTVWARSREAYIGCVLGILGLVLIGGALF